MGLAASQAKLLTITSRLSDNELRSQSVTAAKMALASQSSDASRRYINSLNATEFNYKTYDADGDKVQVPLTGLQMITYAPLKNQYALINSSGQILLTEVDANNYNTSANMDEFLAKYGVDKIDTGETRTVTNPEINADSYRTWLSQEPHQTDLEFWGDIHMSTPDLQTLFDNTITRVSFGSQSINLMERITNGFSDLGDEELCTARNLLSLLINYSSSNRYPQTYGSSTNPSYPVTIEYADCTNETAPIGVSYSRPSRILANTYVTNASANMEEISDAITNGIDGYTFYATEDANHDGYEQIGTGFSTAEEIRNQYLLCNYTRNTRNNTVVPKSLLQKCVDLLCFINLNYNDADLRDHNSRSLNYSYRTHLNQLLNELSSCTIRNALFLEDDYNTAHQTWLDSEPYPTIEEPIYRYSDNDKAQWYINLWHRINGASEEKDGTETVTNTTHGAFSEYGSESTSVTETSSRYRYEILEDGLMNSQQWLKYALETGAVSLERVNFAEETTGDTGLKKAEWKSIIYTNALDITEQSDEHAMAVAEAEYEQAQREIENKDKQYDSILKLLDTEHNALQTEYESVKKVISKNMERTLSIYKA